MFGLLRRAVTPEPVATQIAVAADHDETILADHAALAKRLGVHSAATALIGRVAFESKLHEWGFRVYDRKQVTAYLNAQYPREAFRSLSVGSWEPTWGWRPLRKKDQCDAPSGRAKDGRNGRIQEDLRPYAKAIPYPVLLTVERISTEFPTAQFYVSDEIEKQEVRDPFLMVWFASQAYIIERWDEPNYRER